MQSLWASAATAAVEAQVQMFLENPELARNLPGLARPCLPWAVMLALVDLQVVAALEAQRCPRETPDLQDLPAPMVVVVQRVLTTQVRKVALAVVRRVLRVTAELPAEQLQALETRPVVTALRVLPRRQRQLLAAMVTLRVAVAAAPSMPPQLCFGAAWVLTARFS